MGIEKWRRGINAVDPGEVDTFVAQKILHLAEYDAELAKLEADKACVDRVEMERADFHAKHYYALVDGNRSALKTTRGCIAPSLRH